MSQTTDTRLAAIDQGIIDLRGGVALLSDELRLHGEALNRILELLTPDEMQSGPPLHELLGHLVGRLDRQSLMLKDILTAQVALARNLPLDVVRVIDDNLSVADHPGAPGDQGNGGATQP
jgi:hypothetical protein